MTEKRNQMLLLQPQKERSEKEYKDLINRLSRIEGRSVESSVCWMRIATALTSSHRWRPQMPRSTASIKSFWLII